MTTRLPPSRVSTLRPRGALWDALGPVWQQVEAAIDAAIDRIHARTAQLQAEWIAETISELLPEWEASTGLPNACTPAGQTFAQRRAAVAEVLRSRGGATPQYFIDVAARLGYTATIDERVDGDPYLWRMNLAEATGQRHFRAGASLAGERLLEFSDELLECVINNRRPAHTRVLFAYGVS